MVVSLRGADMVRATDVSSNSALAPAFWPAKSASHSASPFGNPQDFSAWTWLEAITGSVTRPAAHMGFLNAWKSIQV
jgi:hypothetical protein